MFKSTIIALLSLSMAFGAFAAPVPMPAAVAAPAPVPIAGIPVEVLPRGYGTTNCGSSGHC